MAFLPSKPNPRLLHIVIVVALLLGSPLGLHGQRHRALLSLDLQRFEARRLAKPERVIVNGSRAEIDALAERHHLAVVRYLKDSAVVLANSAQVTELASETENLSGDLPVAPFMSVSNSSTAADQTREGTSGIPGVTGQGITVAVVDSGISAHPALSQKVIANVSYVSADPSVADPFGHGTHIAGIIAGTNTRTTSLYNGGIAPGAKLVNVRVLGKNGTGWTSDVIAGIEWAIANRALYKIRIINLSLGHAVTEPSATDPLCIAVKKAALAGIVVVTSAGNAGKAADGSPILGGITSPGNSPYAITVGALNTKATISRRDDVMATYSSRGPTRFDFAVKPDVVAPGNKIVSLESFGASLAKNNSFLHVAGAPTNAYMQLSGTSMAAAMVSGGAALLMQGSSSITSEQIKIALQVGSTFMKDGGLVGGGAGSVNFWSTRKDAANGLTNLETSLIGGLPAPSSGVTFWDEGTMARRIYYRTGIRLLSLLEAPLAWLTPGYLHWGDPNLIGLSNPLATTRPNEIIWGDAAGWTSDHEIIWGDTISNPEGQEIIWGDSSVTQDNEIIWGDSAEADDPR